MGKERPPRAYRLAELLAKLWIGLSAAVIGGNYLLQKWLAPPAVVCSSPHYEPDARWLPCGVGDPAPPQCDYGGLVPMGGRGHDYPQCGRAAPASCANATYGSEGDNGPAAAHPWHRWLATKVSRLPLGRADYCLIEKNMITQLIFLKCRSYLKHLRKWGLSQSTPIFPSLSLSIAHTFCLREVRRRLDDGRDALNTLSWHTTTAVAPTCQSNNSQCSNDTAAERTLSAPNGGGPLVVIVRDPIERFASGYVQACVSKHTYPYIALDWAGRCLGCAQGDVCCFARRLKQAMDAPEVLRAMSQTTSNHIGEHLLPQTAYCSIKRATGELKLIPWSRRREMLTETLVEHGVARDYLQTGWGDMGRQAFLASRTMHATGIVQKEVLQLIAGNPQLQDLLRYIYRDDYAFIHKHNLAHLL